MPAQVLNVRSPLPPNQSASASLPLNTMGPIQKMEPLGTLQVCHGSFQILYTMLMLQVMHFEAVILSELRTLELSHDLLR